MQLYRILLIFMDLYDIWDCMELYRFYVELFGFTWNHMDLCGIIWNYMKWSYMDLHGIRCNYVELYGSI